MHRRAKAFSRFLALSVFGPRQTVAILVKQVLKGVCHLDEKGLHMSTGHTVQVYVGTSSATRVLELSRLLSWPEY